MLGLHPTEVRADYGEVLGRMEALLQAGHSFIGIGEVGLDYYWDRTYYKEQQEAFRCQVEWSLVIRSSPDDSFPFRTKRTGGPAHSFSYERGCRSFP